MVLAGVILAPMVFAETSSSHEVGGVLSTPVLQSPGLNGTVNNCNPLTVTNGTVAPYPECTITCASNYTLSGGTTCVESSTIHTCTPATVANGTVADYPSCAITCANNYTLSGGTCVYIAYSGGGGGGGGTPTTPTSSTQGDLTGDNKVDFFDFNILMMNWGKTGSNIADLNNDGIVDFFDFNILMMNWTK